MEGRKHQLAGRQAYQHGIMGCVQDTGDRKCEKEKRPRDLAREEKPWARAGIKTKLDRQIKLKKWEVLGFFFFNLKSFPLILIRNTNSISRSRVQNHP